MKSCLRLVTLFLLAILPGACSEKPQTHALPDPPRVSDCQPGTPGGTLVLAVPGNPQTFNPVLEIDNASDAVVRLLFSSLVSVNMETQTAEPGLAESWSVAPDQKTWTFKLRRNLRWSDGQPLTAEDVVFTWNSIMYDPQLNHLTYELFRSNGKNFLVTNIDDTTVQVVTPEVFAPFVEYFGSTVILPKHVLSRWVYGGQFLHAYSTTNRPEDIVGSGPFRLKEFQDHKVVRLERNPDYWVVDKQGRRLPYFDEVQLDITTNQVEFESLFLNGKTAAYETIRPDDTWEFQQATSNGISKFVDLGPGAQRDVVWFNQNTGADKDGTPFVDPAKLKWFRDKRFRQAVSSAINRDRIVSQVYNGRAAPVFAFLSSDNKKWDNPDVPRFPYDPAKARALLAEMGMTNHSADGSLLDDAGNPVQFTLTASRENPARKKMVMLIAEDLKTLGIRVDYSPAEFPELLRLISITRKYEAASMGLGGGGLDPASQMNILKSDAQLHQWFPSQTHPSTDWEARLDALMDMQMHTLDFAERKKYFDEAQAIWAEQMPMVCIAAPSIAAAIHANIGNVRPVASGAYHLTWNIEELYLKK